MDQKTESELLFQCLGVGTGKVSVASLEQLSTADWDKVIRQSGKHGIIPLLYHRFKATGAMAHIPTEIVGKLRNTYLYSADRNIRLYNEFSKALRILQNNDIPVIVLKGAALAELVYQNIALRPMADIDLIAKSEDLWRIDKVLSQSGYKSDAESLLLSKRHVQWVRHIVYTKKFVQIEIHPGIYELSDFDPWIKASPVTISSIDTLILGPEDFLLHLCIHLLDHLYIRDEPTRLIWWIDIVEILKHYREKLDWDYVIRTVKEGQIEPAICRVLYGVSEWFDGNVPADVLAQIKSDNFAVSLDDILNKERIQNPVSDSLLSYMPSISSINSIRNKMYHIFRSVFPCKEYMIHRYSIAQPNRIHFAYLIRIGKGVIKAVKALYHLPGYLKHKRVSSSGSLRDLR